MKSGCYVRNCCKRSNQKLGKNVKDDVYKIKYIKRLFLKNEMRFKRPEDL